jgi:hypothetical protein
MNATQISKLLHYIPDLIRYSLCQQGWPYALSVEPIFRLPFDAQMRHPEFVVEG